MLYAESCYCCLHYMNYRPVVVNVHFLQLEAGQIWTPSAIVKHIKQNNFNVVKAITQVKHVF